MLDLSLACLAMASINFYVGVYYLAFYLKLRRFGEHLPFAVLCIGVGLYDLFCVGLYRAESLSEGILWQRQQFGAIDLMAISMLWFTMKVGEKKRDPIVRFLTILFVGYWIAAWFLPESYTLSVHSPAIKHIHAGLLGSVTYYEGSIGPLYQAEMITVFGAYLYGLLLLILFYRKISRGSVMVIFACLIVYLAGVLNDSAVSMQIYNFIYVSEYCFFFVVLSMAYLLLDNFGSVQKAYEDLNLSLERKVEERTREIMAAREEIEELSEFVPICSNCKKIRDDKGFWERLESYFLSRSGVRFTHSICPDCAKKLFPEAYDRSHDGKSG